MMDFSLSIDLGKQQRITPETESMPVDRAFVARSLIALAAKIQTDPSARGAILDDAGTEVGSWKFALRLPSES